MVSLRAVAWLSGFVAIAAASDWSLWRDAAAPRAVDQVRVTVGTDATIATVDEKYLSVAIDMANVVGGAFWDPSRTAGPMGTSKVAAYDFSRPALRKMAAALAPAFLRVGGTDADRTVYELASARKRPAADTWLLTTAQWRNLNTFAQDVGWRVMFTLNAGAAARNADGAWDPTSARALVQDAELHKYPVDVWEFGNELNVYPLLHAQWLSPRSYADDLQQARWLLRDASPTSRLAGPAVAFWPHIGEGLPFMRPFMKSGGDLVDIITWHYYPQQSFRCPVATNRARAGQVLKPKELAEIDRWATFVEKTKSDYGSHAEVWLGETGGAQCGGEPDLSDRFASSLWWIDQLGRVARRGQKVVVRQTLSGGDYGLIDDATMAPNPDYWASLLWRRLMGTRVLNAAVDVGDAPVQAYAHCMPGGSATGVAMALVNEHPSQTTQVHLPRLQGEVGLFVVTAQGPTARTVFINGKEPRLTADGDVPSLVPAQLNVGPNDLLTVALPPHSYAFVVFPQAQAKACAARI